MGHSVHSHLGIETGSYDRAIRRFIPAYEVLLEVAARELVRCHPKLVLDLGAGTGALSEAILLANGTVTVELIDTDPEMLALAQARLDTFKARARFSGVSFLENLPSCDGASASLALHHIRTMDEKRTVYRSIYNAVRPGGSFVNADAAVPAESSERAAVMGEWVEHMVGCGIGEVEACGHLEKWGEEDTYFPLEEELEAIEAAGFEARCVWRRGPMAVVVGRKGT